MIFCRTVARCVRSSEDNWGGLMQPYKAALIERLRRFIRIPSRSSSSGGDEGALQEVMASEMSRLGARVSVFEASDLPAFKIHFLCHGPDRNYKGRPTVTGEIGPPDAPALLVLAHSDTVQIFQPDLWTVDPFSGELRDGSIYGLGASDDKWGLASILTMMQELQDSGINPRKRIIFASTIDEENGVGNGALLLHLRGVKAEAALYLDGINMEVNIGCLGGSNLYLEPLESLSVDRLSADVATLTDACATFSKQRMHLFEIPFYEKNAMRDRSIQVRIDQHHSSPRIIMPFYTLPTEHEAQFRTQLEQLVDNALHGRAADYCRSYRQPWFESALVSPQTPLVNYLSASHNDVFEKPARVTTISKQDSFVLTNHSHIPTVSFGCTRRFDGKGAFHNPDERLDLDELWDGFQVAHGAVRRWLEAN
jgi:acetylornithine deacetylase/succinyl-diaminopimelate desuccinylase-like protein